MIITTTTILIVQAIVIGTIMWTTPEPCPREYTTTRTHLLFEKCELDYGGKWMLKNE